MQLSGRQFLDREQQTTASTSVAELGRRLRSQGGHRRWRHGRRSRCILPASRREVRHQADQSGKVEHQHGRALERDPGNLNDNLNVELNRR